MRRIQKYVEKLDLIKLRNSMASSNGNLVSPQAKQNHSNGNASSPSHHHRNSSMQSLGDSLIDCDSPKQQSQPSRHSASGSSVVITTQWETFDSTSNPFLGAPSTSTTEKSTVRANQSGFSWNLL